MEPEKAGITFRAETVKGRMGTKRSRWVPLSRAARSALDAQISEAVRLGSTFVFPARQNPRMHLAVHSASCAWEALRKKVGISGRFHDLRHTFITRALLRGQAPALIAKFVGHFTTAMIDRNYGHLWRGHREDLASILPKDSQKPSVAA